MGEEWWGAWVNYLAVDPEERLALRRRQKLSLSRYARVDYHSWGDVPLEEMERLMEELVALLEKESPSPSQEEHV